MNIHVPIMSFKHQQALIAQRLSKATENVTERRLDEDIPSPKKVKKTKSIKTEKPEDTMPYGNTTATLGNAQGSTIPMQNSPDNSSHTVNVDEL